MTGNSDDILRLKNCLQCGYDLKGLPKAHACPECGRVYSGEDFEIWGRQWAAYGMRWWLPLLVCALGLLVIFALRAAGWLEPVLVPFLALSFLFMCVIITFIYYRIHRQPARFQILITRESLCNYGQVDGEFEWSELRGIIVSPLKAGSWRIKVVGKGGWFSFMEQKPVDVVIEAGKEEVDVIVKEIQRRIDCKDREETA